MAEHLEQAHMISSFVRYLMPSTASTERINHSIFLVH